MGVLGEKPSARLKGEGSSASSVAETTGSVPLGMATRKPVGLVGSAVISIALGKGIEQAPGLRSGLQVEGRPSPMEGGGAGEGAGEPFEVELQAAAAASSAKRPETRISRQHTRPA